MRAIKKLILSFKYAIEGFWHCILRERNFRVHLFAAVTVCLLGYYYHFDAGEQVRLALVIALVLICEMFNSSIELVVDLVSRKRSIFAKRAKDVAAGAVLLSTLCAVVVGAKTLWKPSVFAEIGRDVLGSGMKIAFVIAYILFSIVFIFFLNEKKREVERTDEL